MFDRQILLDPLEKGFDLPTLALLIRFIKPVDSRKKRHKNGPYIKTRAVPEPTCFSGQGQPKCLEQKTDLVAILFG